MPKLHREHVFVSFKTASPKSCCQSETSHLKLHQISTRRMIVPHLLSIPSSWWRNDGWRRRYRHGYWWGCRHFGRSWWKGLHWGIKAPQLWSLFLKSHIFKNQIPLDFNQLAIYCPYLMISNNWRLKITTHFLQGTRDRSGRGRSPDLETETNSWAPLTCLLGSHWGDNASASILRQSAESILKVFIEMVDSLSFMVLVTCLEVNSKAEWRQKSSTIQHVVEAWTAKYLTWATQRVGSVRQRMWGQRVVISLPDLLRKSCRSIKRLWITDYRQHKSDMMFSRIY